MNIAAVGYGGARCSRPSTPPAIHRIVRRCSAGFETPSVEPNPLENGLPAFGLLPRTVVISCQQLFF